MLKGKKVLLLTASHLSSCPRLIKEANLLYENGADIHIVYLNSISFLEGVDDVLREKYFNWNFYPIYWKGKNANKIKVLQSKLIYKFNHILNLDSDFIQSTSKVLIDATLKIKADLYIVHHPSLLPAAAKAAKKYNAKFIYDIEDAFPFVEDNSFIDNPDIKIINIERKYINRASLLSTASPLYKSLYKKLYNLNIEPVELLNVFNLKKNDVIEYKDRTDLSKTSLYWFSQTVGLNRGLQDLFVAINYLDPTQYELHIRGNCSEEVKNSLLSLVSNTEHHKNIYFHKIVSIDELELRNAEHDIGLALELPTTLNRDLCISNKILDYISKGLAVIATNTNGHAYILSQLELTQYLYNCGESEKLVECLRDLISNKEILNVYKSNSLKLATDKYNWHTHSKNWLLEVNKLVQ